MRRTSVLATALTLSLAGATAASAASGTGEVTDSLVGTVAPGLLTISGSGVNVAASSTPGSFGNSVGTTLVTVNDLTGGAGGWSVTANYVPPTDPATKDIGGANVLVSATGLSTDLTGIDLKPASNQPLSTPVTVATTGESAGGGVTAFVAQYKVRLPATAKVGESYGGSVTYTVATVR
jgi:hypothetical protein